MTMTSRAFDNAGTSVVNESIIEDILSSLP